MAEVAIIHKFQSAKPNSSDPTLVSKDAWNDDLNISGGSNGNFVKCDNTADNGAVWVQGAKVNAASGTYSGASPSSSIPTLTVSFDGLVTGLLFANIILVTSDASNATLRIFRDGVAFSVITVLGNGVAQMPAISIISETAGSHTWTCTITTSGGGVTITSLTISLAMLTVGA